MPNTSSSRRSLSILPDVSLLGVAIIWGVNIPFMKMGLGLLDNVYIFNALRLPISAIVLVCFAAVERRRGIFPQPDVRFWHIAIYCVAVSIFYQLSFLMGMSRTTPGNAALILATVPMWTAIFAWMFIGERLRPISWFGLAVALAGTIVVAIQSDSVSHDTQLLLGNLIMLVSALLWAGGTVYSKPLLAKISPLQLSASATLLGLPAHFAFAWFAAVAAPVDSVDAGMAFRSATFWLVILFSGMLSSGLSQPMWSYGVRQAGAAHAAVVQNLVPVVAIFAAWAIFKVHPTLPQIVGGAMILGGLCLMRVGRRMAAIGST